MKGKSLVATAGTITLKLPNVPFLTAVICLGCFTSARLAALALGLDLPRTYRFVPLPQAFRNMLPVPDFVGAASKVARRDGRLVEMYTFAALVYFVLCCLLPWLARQLQKRVAIVR